MMKTILKIMFVFSTCMLMNSCNYSVIMNATHGHASDVVDETDNATADVSPNIEVPTIP